MNATAGGRGTLWYVILLLLALGGGLWAFQAGRFGGATLVLHARTFAKGTGTVLCEERGSGRVMRLHFPIGSDDGEPSYYVVPLPATPLQSVRILPLGEAGTYDISRLYLSGDRVRYRWDEKMACTAQPLAGEAGRREPCGSGAPVLSVNQDGSVLLAPLPATPERGGLLRLGLGLLGGGLIFLGGLFLMRLPRELPRGEIAGATLARAAWLAVLLLFCYQYVLVARYSVDLPFYEEWEFFEPEALQRGLSLAWLFQHFGTNQQVVVPTKLMAWLDFKLFALDFVRLKLMNYAVFGCLLVWLGLFARRVAGEGERLVPCFMLFLVSPLAYEVHAASFQSGETFVMLFGTGMLWYAVTDRTTWRDTLLFALCGLLAIFSMHTGVVVAALLLACRSLHLVSRIRCGELPGRTGYGAMALSGGVILPGIAYWLSGFGPPPAGSPPWLLPTEGKFWAQFFNLLAYGFGFDTPNVLPGIACLLLLLVPLVLLLANRETRWRPATWQVLPAILVLLALTMMITLGRGNMAGSIKLSRYTLYLSPLILFGALAWWLALRRGRKAYAVLALYWLFCAGAFLDNWHYGVYRDLQHSDTLNLECVESFANGSGDGVCPETHGKPIGPFLINARRLDISFTRQFAPSPQPK